MLPILELSMLPILERTVEGQPIFQQDGAAIHTAHATAEFLEANDVEVLPWPARSPDLNPIENLWCDMVRDVYKDARSFATLAELRAALQQSWERIPVQTIRNLFLSMSNRRDAVIQAHGGETKY